MAKRSSRTCFRNRTQRPRDRRLPTASRIRLGLLVLTGLCLLLAMRCLDLIGPPPAVRIDALWVNQHAYLVRVMLAALAGAAGATVLLLLTRRGRIPAIGLWAVAAGTSLWLFDDRLWIIFLVVIRHA